MRGRCVAVVGRRSCVVEGFGTASSVEIHCPFLATPVRRVNYGGYTVTIGLQKKQTDALRLTQSTWRHLLPR
jgi:hypothetical protein